MQSECVNNIRQAQRSVPEALLVRYEGRMEKKNALHTDVPETWYQGVLQTLSLFIL